MVPMTPKNEIKVSSSRLLHWFQFSNESIFIVPLRFNKDH
jgi:hypothetical protein